MLCGALLACLLCFAAAAAGAAQGIRKTKLGLREFIKLGDFVQQIDTDNKLAVSSCAAAKILNGQL